MKNRLYVGNLSFDTSEDELRGAFSEYGDVSDVKIVTDRDTGRPRGFGFVTLDSDAAAASAVESMDGSSLGGRSLRVNIAEERPARGGGGGGGAPRRSNRSPRW